MWPNDVDLSADQQFILSLCSGGGGLDLGVRLAVPTARTVGYVEIEAFACATLVHQMEALHLDPAPVWTDLRSFDSGRWRGAVDGIIGGYPCQPFSVAGKQRGREDPRHLWPVIRDCVDAIRPAWCFFENVANHLQLGFDQVSRELQALGYDVAAGVFTAEEVGATHRRERLFILAVVQPGRAEWGTMADSGRRDQGRATGRRETQSGGPFGELAGSSTDVEYAPILGRREGGTASSLRSRGNAAAVPSSRMGDTNPTRLEGRIEPVPIGTCQLPPWPPSPTDDAGWLQVLQHAPHLAPAIESDVRRMAHGMAARVDRLRLLGNGVVPTQAAWAFWILAVDLWCDRRGYGRSLCRREGQDIELIEWP